MKRYWVGLLALAWTATWASKPDPKTGMYLESAAGWLAGQQVNATVFKCVDALVVFAARPHVIDATVRLAAGLPSWWEEATALDKEASRKGRQLLYNLLSANSPPLWRLSPATLNELMDVFLFPSSPDHGQGDLVWEILSPDRLSPRQFTAYEVLRLLGKNQSGLVFDRRHLRPLIGRIQSQNFPGPFIELLSLALSEPLTLENLKRDSALVVSLVDSLVESAFSFEASHGSMQAAEFLRVHGFFGRPTRLTEAQIHRAARFVAMPLLAQEAQEHLKQQVLPRDWEKDPHFPSAYNAGEAELRCLTRDILTVLESLIARPSFKVPLPSQLLLVRAANAGGLFADRLVRVLRTNGKLGPGT